MWEMWLVCFVKTQHKNHLARVRCQELAKGIGGILGNKGGIAASFTLYNRLFNIVATHLSAKPGKIKERNDMSSALINEFKLQEFQSEIGGLECDILAEFSFFMGDLNYRLETDYNQLMAKGKEHALEMVQTAGDQFFIAKESGYFVNYNEPEIDFMPTYKLNKNKPEYVNKNNQAPSYCDRILVKINSSLQVTDEQYVGRHDLFGSDHRPVQRVTIIKGLANQEYSDVQRLFQMDKPVIGYGEFDIMHVDLKGLDLQKVGKVNNFDFRQLEKALQLRVSFFDFAIDTTACPITFSQEKLIYPQMLFNNNLQVTNEWDHKTLPCFYSALNQIELASKGRLVMLIWACGPIEHFPNEEMLLG